MSVRAHVMRRDGKIGRCQPYESAAELVSALADSARKRGLDLWRFPEPYKRVVRGRLTVKRGWSVYRIHVPFNGTPEAGRSRAVVLVHPADAAEHDVLEALARVHAKEFRAADRATACTLQ